MSQLSTAARLLGELQKHSEVLRDTVASAAGITIERARQATCGSVKLTLAEQLRLAESIPVFVPSLARQALALRNQVVAATRFEAGDVLRHREGCSDRWERSAALRR